LLGSHGGLQLLDYWVGFGIEDDPSWGVRGEYVELPFLRLWLSLAFHSIFHQHTLYLPPFPSNHLLLFLGSRFSFNSLLPLGSFTHIHRNHLNVPVHLATCAWTL
jgi:hypothetical protein